MSAGATLLEPGTLPVYCLTLWRPWPWAIFALGKRVENRSWYPKHLCGPMQGGVAQAHFSIAIHAGLSMDEEALDQLTKRFCRGRGGKRKPNAFDLICGDIVSYARVSRVFGVIGPHGGRHPLATLHNYWAHGPCCWELTDVRRFARPIPRKGRQGLGPQLTGGVLGSVLREAREARSQWAA